VNNSVIASAAYKQTDLGVFEPPGFKKTAGIEKSKKRNKPNKTEKMKKN
jgi:hypothetical protein